MSSLDSYFALIREYPELFAEGTPKIILDPEAIASFQVQTGKKIGVVYDNSPFYRVIADLCETPSGKRFAYARTIPCGDYNHCGAAMLITRQNINKKREFLLLKHFRHSFRDECLEIPRGFADIGEAPDKTAARELAEETGITQIQDTRFLGYVRSDTGTSAGRAALYLCDCGTADLLSTDAEEGIRGGSWVSEDQLIEMIQSGAITDAFTLTAYLYYSLSR